MPNRILRDYTDSPAFDGLSAEAERLFIRLIMKADDFGRFHANPKLVKAACFPLAEDLRANTVAAWLTELSDRQLVFCYTSGTGSYLQIPKFGEPRAKSSKYPPPPDDCERQKTSASVCEHLQADASRCSRIRLSPIESERESARGREDSDSQRLENISETSKRLADAERIRQLYPRQSHQAEARDWIMQSLNRGELPQTITAGVEACASAIRELEKRLGAPSRWVPSPAAFFEKERWREPEVFAASIQPKGKGGNGGPQAPGSGEF